MKPSHLVTPRQQADGYFCAGADPIESPTRMHRDDRIVVRAAILVLVFLLGLAAGGGL
jgi:hypothetical protein